MLSNLTITWKWGRNLDCRKAPYIKRDAPACEVLRLISYSYFSKEGITLVFGKGWSGSPLLSSVTNLSYLFSLTEREGTGWRQVYVCQWSLFFTSPSETQEVESPWNVYGELGIGRRVFYDSIRWNSLMDNGYGEKELKVGIETNLMHLNDEDHSTKSK